MCTFCTIKCFFMLFNGLILVSGIGLIILGAQYSMYTHIVAFSWALDALSILLIALGVIIVLLSFSGFCAACTDNYSMVACFICVLIMVILLEILTGSCFYLLSSRIDTVMNTKAKDLMNDSENSHFSNSSIQEKGCLSAVKQYLYTNMLWVGAVCIVLGLAEVLGVIAGICFFNEIKREKSPQPQMN